MSDRNPGRTNFVTVQFQKDRAESLDEYLSWNETLAFVEHIHELNQFGIASGIVSAENLGAAEWYLFQAMFEESLDPQQVLDNTLFIGQWIAKHRSLAKQLWGTTFQAQLTQVQQEQLGHVSRKFLGEEW